MITHYIKVAVRHILKYKTQNLISIIGLSVGILCFSICLYCSRYIYDTNKCFERKDRIAELSMITPDGDTFSGMTATATEELQKFNLAEVEAFTFVSYNRKRDYNIEVTEGKELPYTLSGIEIDSLFLQVFTPEVLQGSWERASHTPNAIVLTRSTAEHIFGKDGNPIGKPMTLTTDMRHALPADLSAASTAYTVQAVIADLPENISLSFLKRIDILHLNDSHGLLLNKVKDMTGGDVYALLRPGQTAAELQASFIDKDAKLNVFRQDNSLQAAPLGQSLWEQPIAPIFAGVTFALGVLILLTGLLNFFQFLIGTFLNRRREYGIRKVAGCSTSRLFAQLSVQTTVISLFAFLIAFCLIELASPHLNLSLYTFTIPIAPHTLMLHAAEYMVGILLLGMFLSLLTAWRVRKVTVMVGMNANTTRGGKHRVRNLLLGVQFFICFLFVSCTLALYLQAGKTSGALLDSLTRQEKSEILSIPLQYPFMSNEQKQELTHRLTQHSGVADHMLTNGNFLQRQWRTGIYKDLTDRNSYIQVNILHIPQNFFDFMHIPFTSGRALGNMGETVIDQTLADRLQQAPLGMMLYNYSQEGYSVSGVFQGICTSTSDKNIGYFCILNEPNEELSHCYIKCASGKTDEVRAYVEQVLQEALPESVEIKVNTLMDDIVAEQALENSLKGIILFFSIVSLIITLLGVYSAITLDTERRQKEVAIRKVNGAGMKQIVMLFARLYITLLLVTAVIALPLGYAVTVGMKQMYTVFFDNGPLFWCGIFVFVAAVTTLTVLFRILKIARINPAEVIKNE